MYIKNFITFLRRYTTSSLLNVVGMAVAFASVYLILVQVKHDLSYDKVIPNSENIYRLESPNWYEEGKWSYNWNRQWPDEMCADVPEIEASGSIWIYASGAVDFSIKRNQTIDNLKINLSMNEFRFQQNTILPYIWGRKWQPTPILLPRESCGWKSLVGCCP